MKLIFHPGTGTLIAADECKVIDSMEFVKAFLDKDAVNEDEYVAALDALSEGDYDATQTAKKSSTPLNL